MTKPLPEHPRRIVLLNPTKYLGNLLLAGGLMQAFAKYCQSRDITLKIVLDESFRELCEHSFADDCLLFFPRRDISTAGFLKKLSLYRNCLQQIRTFRADLAFNIEEDSATSHLTRLSGASYKLGCSPARHTSGYDHVVPVQFENRAPGHEHRWYSYYEVFAALGMPEPTRSYINLTLDGLTEGCKQKLVQASWQPEIPTIALHAGATKDYKKWPLAHMAELVQRIQAAGLQPVLLGAGKNDAANNAEIKKLLEQQGCQTLPVDLCNTLSLLELGQFLKSCTFMVGNDSGPFHLGSALGVPGGVLWGPTNKNIWGPLGQHSDIIQGSLACDPDCNKGYCLHEHRCLTSISPAQVCDNVLASIHNTNHHTIRPLL